MNTEIRDVVVRALDEAVGILRDPAHGPAVLRGEDLKFADLDLDSLSTFEMLMFIEDELGIDIELDEVEDLPGIAALTQYLGSRATAG